MHPSRPETPAGQGQGRRGLSPSRASCKGACIPFLRPRAGTCPLPLQSSSIDMAFLALPPSALEPRLRQGPGPGTQGGRGQRPAAQLACGPSGLLGEEALKRRELPQARDLRVEMPVTGFTPSAYLQRAWDRWRVGGLGLGDGRRRKGRDTFRVPRRLSWFTRMGRAT